MKRCSRSRGRGGRAIARRNLWISVPCLLLSFAVWMVWSVVVAKLPSIGFAYSTDQLFWLAALPGLSGATLRIFYSFMVPVFGGRLWTTLTTWSATGRLRVSPLKVFSNPADYAEVQAVDMVEVAVDQAEELASRVQGQLMDWLGVRLGIKP